MGLHAIACICMKKKGRLAQSVEERIIFSSKLSRIMAAISPESSENTALPHLNFCLMLLILALGLKELLSG